MSNDLIIHDFAGFAIGQRQIDGYVNATAMCKATSKEFADYFRLKSAQAFLTELSADLTIPMSGLVIINKGGNAKKAQATFVHPQIAINLAQWCSPQFAVFISKLVFAWMKDSFSSNQLPTVAVALPPIEVQVVDALEKIEKLNLSQPRVAQLLRDGLISRYLESQNASLAPVEEPKLRGVAEIAQDLGFKVTHSNRSNLGKFVKANLPHLADKKEERLVNGTQRPVHCYPDVEEVHAVIHDFFS